MRNRTYPVRGTNVISVLPGSLIAVVNAALAGLLLIGTSNTALGVKAGPGPVTCTGQCETCIEYSGPDNVCQKCGVDPKCLDGDPGLSSDFTAMLNAHNGYRARHGTPALSWSPQLAKSAQDWANACTKQHSKDAWQSAGGFGENLYWGSGNLGDANDAVDWWYAEIKDYKFEAPAWSGAVGHFTQVVWKGSKQLGCGVARCGNENYWVCRYSPTGNWNTNMPGVLADNVPPIGGIPRTQSTAPAPAEPPPPVLGGATPGGNVIEKIPGDVMADPTPAAPAPPATSTCTIKKDSDIYAAPGGAKIGFLAANTPAVTLLARQGTDWFNLNWPAGQGWGFSGPGYEDAISCP